MLEAVIEVETWRRITTDLEGYLWRIHAAACAREAALGADMALLLTDDERLRVLNRRFRGVDKATNVLSFPSGGAHSRYLGDIALAYGVCRSEAEEKGISIADHTAHLIVHGLLHLVGYDHESDDDAERMEGLETQILASLGVADPYGDDGRAT